MKIYPLVTIIAITILLGAAGCTPQESYTGEMKNGLPHGTGTWIHTSGAKYVGEFREGHREGQGTWTHTSGISYTGQWQKDRYHGRGTLTMPERLVYEGQWREGMRHGHGIQTWADGRRYEGFWEDDLIHGYGLMLYPDGSFYDGEWAGGRRNGRGTLITAEGEVLTGEWIADEYQYIPVESLTLNRSDITMSAGGSSFTLVAVIEPEEASNQVVTWSSSEPAVAKVEGGLVTPLAPGETIITAVTDNGKLEASCIIRVTPPPVSVTGVTLDRNTLTLQAGGSGYTLIATIHPYNAANKVVTWHSSNTAIAPVDSYGRVTPLQPGSAVISVRTFDGGFTATCEVTVIEPPDENNDSGNDSGD